MKILNFSDYLAIIVGIGEPAKTSLPPFVVYFASVKHAMFFLSPYMSVLSVLVLLGSVKARV